MVASYRVPILRLCSKYPLLLYFLILGALGCQGRAEFLYLEGQRSLEVGDLGKAYADTYQAWSLAPREKYVRALEGIGRLVANVRLQESRAAARRLDFEHALERSALALEYHQDGAAVRDQYLRAWGTLRGWALLESRIRNAQGDGAKTSMLDAVELSLEAARHPVCPAHVRRELLETAALRLTEEIEELRARTARAYALPLGDRREAVEGLRARWLEVVERLRSHVDRERRTAEGRDITATVAGEIARELARQRIIEACLVPSLSQAEEDEREVRAVLRGLDDYERGLEREREGDLRGAYAFLYRAAGRHWSLGGARGAAEEALERLTRERYEAARTAMARREWGKAIASLEHLRGFAPAYRDAKERLRQSRLEATREHRAAAEHHEAQGLLGAALLHYHEALLASPHDEELRRAAGRIERALRAKIFPPVVVEFRPLEREDRTLRRDLWGVPESAVSAAQKIIAETVAAAHPGSSPAQGGLFLRIEDLDLRCHREDSTTGRETDHVLKSYTDRANPAVVEAQKELATARERVRGLQRRFDEASPFYQPLLLHQLELARERVEQARFQLGALPARVPSLEWEEVAFPSRTIHRAAELAVRLEGEERWITVSWNGSLRTRGETGSRADPPANREALLLRLAGALGERIRDDVARRLETERAAYYHQGLEHLDQGSLDSAVDNLVHYVLSQPTGRETERVQDALRRLEDLSGGRSIAGWLRPFGGGRGGRPQEPAPPPGVPTPPAAAGGGH